MKESFFNERFFPEKIKIATVIPIFKEDELAELQTTDLSRSFHAFQKF